MGIHLLRIIISNAPSILLTIQLSPPEDIKSIIRMRVVALISGGKDSCYNMMQCAAEGHNIVALANLHPKDIDELDSYMYQTVGHMGIEILAKAMSLPLYRRETRGKSTQTGKQYIPTDEDEVEDLYSLLEWTKGELNIEAVAVGAILSDYQRVRVENVCSRLNLIPLAYLWRRDQTEVLQEMIDCQVHAIIIKVAALGLLPDRHLGKSLREIQPHLLKMRDKYGLNVCGEGGEYETFTLDCPLFKQRIVVEDMQTVVSSADQICPVGYINFTKLTLKSKELQQSCDVLVKTSLDYINDLNESTYSDLSDPDFNETELELIEKETRMRESFSQNELSLPRSNSFGRKIVSSPIHIVTKSASVDEPTTIGLCISSTPQSCPPSPIKFEREFRRLSNKPMSAVNSKGWMWIAGIQGNADSAENGMQAAMIQLKDIAKKNDYQLSELCYITLYVRNISEYHLLNEIYSRTFNFTNPPTRVCVECPLPDGCHVILEAVAFKPVNGNGGNCQRHTMHVQGISHWAPANIGPYSQSTRVGDIIYISGQIALVPGSMKIIEGGIRPQCKLALRHISRIAKAMNAAQGQLRDVVQGICFLTHPNYIADARRQWEKRTANAIIDYIVVPALPRGALVEWQVWAHTHNDRFDYEETGCSISDYTISIRRRWNYENNCAAIVCYVSTGLATSTTQLTELSEDILKSHRQSAQNLTGENLDEILTYTLGRLLKDYPITKRSERLEDCQSNGTTPSTTAPDVIQIPGIHLKVFYQIAASPKVDLLLDGLHDFVTKVSDTASIACTLLPAYSLHNFSTFLSICGIRHE